MHWASTTLKSYNSVIKQLFIACKKQCITFPPDSTSDMAEILLLRASRSARPESIVKTTLACTGALLRGLGKVDVTQSELIVSLKSALIKSGTKLPMVHSNVMPVYKFFDLFTSWEDNDMLTVKLLRMKCIALLSLCLMLRPSDLAPNSYVFENDECFPNEFSVDMLEDLSDRGFKLTLFGIKNDSDRTGFVVHLPTGSVPKLDPCEALRCYLQRTSCCRSEGCKGVFITLQRPFRALGSSAIAKELNTVIKLAGLDRNKYSAKSFRPTGATVAVEAGLNHEEIRNLGRWKSPAVFYKHYVMADTNSCYTDDVLCHKLGRTS